MAKNTGLSYRSGVVSNRTQVYNEKTNKYIKRDTKTGQFLSSKDTPYKNIRKEKPKEEQNEIKSKSKSKSKTK